MLITLAVPVVALKMHVINLNDMLAGRQIRKTKLFSGSPIGMRQALKKDTLTGKVRLGKLVQSVLLEKKKSLHTWCSFPTELFFHAVIGVFCFVLFCFECWVTLPFLLYTYTYIHTCMQEPPDCFLIIFKR